MQPTNRLRFLVLATALLLTGCATSGVRTMTKSSVVDYLYPDQSQTVIQPSVAVLNVPLKAGIAFVPGEPSRLAGANTWSGRAGGNSLSAATRTVLLERVASHFRKYRFISDIEVIPTAYLTAGGSFRNLEQIRTMYDVDVIALVSYDQVQFTDEGLLSLTYWTLVGAYVVAGEKNDTSTMLDTVVYDIPSRRMLFRAPGTSRIKGSATPVNLSEELRADSLEGFEQAAENMISNLDLQLTGFREKIKTRPEQVKIAPRAGYSGGGAIGLTELSVALLALVLVFARERLIPTDYAFQPPSHSRTQKPSSSPSATAVTMKASTSVNRLTKSL